MHLQPGLFWNIKQQEAPANRCGSGLIENGKSWNRAGIRIVYPVKYQPEVRSHSVKVVKHRDVRHGIDGLNHNRNEILLFGNRRNGSTGWLLHYNNFHQEHDVHLRNNDRLQ